MAIYGNYCTVAKPLKLGGLREAFTKIGVLKLGNLQVQEPRAPYGALFKPSQVIDDRIDDVVTPKLI